MKRRSALSLVLGLLLLGVASPAWAVNPEATLSPDSGPAGSEVTVHASEFPPNWTLEVRILNANGTLLGSGIADGAGNASVPIKVPLNAPEGSFWVFVCSTGPNIGCGDLQSVTDSVAFTVTPPLLFTVPSITMPPPFLSVPPSVTTTTTPSVITTPPITTPPVTIPGDLVVPLGGGCEIPAGSVVIDFDEITGWRIEHADVAAALALDEFYGGQFDHVQVTGPGEYDRIGVGPYTETVAVIADNPAAVTPDNPYGLGTTSPPNVLRFVDEAHFTVVSYRILPAEMDYFGFNVGFGHFSEGMDRPEEVVLEMSIRLLPYHELDGTITEGAWDTVSVTLGPGPQPVTTCFMATNTEGIGHPQYSTWLIDIYPRTPDGDPLHVPIDIDDVFYGSSGPSVADIELGTPVPVSSTLATLPDQLPVETIPPVPTPEPAAAAVPQESSGISNSDLPLVIALVVLSIGLGAILTLFLQRR